MPSVCPRCGKSVYAAEERNAGGHKYHNVCFKCTMCNKLLDSMTVAEHLAELFCRQCHGRRYGPKGVGFGIGGGTLTMDTGEQFGNKEVEMTHVQQAAGQHQLLRARRRALLQDVPRAEVRAQGRRLWTRRRDAEHGLRRALRQHLLRDGEPADDGGGLHGPRPAQRPIVASLRQRFGFSVRSSRLSDSQTVPSSPCVRRRVGDFAALRGG